MFITPAPGFKGPVSFHVRHLMPAVLHVLAESPGFVLGHSYESVILLQKSNESCHLAGEHYGDPTLGLITPNEEWFISAGEGLQCYSPKFGLKTFFRQGSLPLLLAAEERCWHIHSVRLVSSSVLRILVDPWSEQASVWELDLQRQSLIKIQNGPSLSGHPYRDDVPY